MVRGNSLLSLLVLWPLPASQIHNIQLSGCCLSLIRQVSYYDPMISQKAQLCLEKYVLECKEMDIFYTEGCLLFREQAPSVPHKFFIFC